MKKFTKDDLKPNMLVELRNGTIYIVVVEFDEKFLINEYDWQTLDDYNQDLSYSDRYSIEYDIMKVRKAESITQLTKPYRHNAPVIWDRDKAQIILSDVERAILENLDEETHQFWLTRNQSGRLLIHKKRPEKSELTNVWNGEQTLCSLPYSKLFQFIKWTDTEPYLISNLINSNSNKG